MIPVKKTDFQAVALGLALGFVWWFSGRNSWAGIVMHGVRIPPPDWALRPNRFPIPDA
jgi:hypothetical protein